MKLIIPAAGYGSRLWPLTKVVAKEFLPVGKNPAIDFIIAEAFNAGITEIIIVISQQKSYLRDYFIDLPNLPAFNFLRAALEKIKVDFVLQEPIGLGDAVAKGLKSFNLTSDELVAIALPDEILVESNGRPCGLEQLVKCNHESILVQQTQTDLLNLYGVIQFTNLVINKIIEKPALKEAPSDLAVVGRYLLNGQRLLFNLQESRTTDDNRFTLALNKSFDDRPILLEKLEAKRFDTGSFDGYFKANNFFMQHDYKLI
jgi:UTP--glucose-1-phosphate uridylyltransferase